MPKSESALTPMGARRPRRSASHMGKRTGGPGNCSSMHSLPGAPVGSSGAACILVSR
jgi:hypothetical protein